MLRLKDSQLTMWDVLLPDELIKLNEELTKVDRFLDDNRFLAPFLEHFNVKIGRPTIPIETFLRLMYIKYRYQLGYEVLVKEINDSIAWRRFCRIPLTDRVPHATTLIKLTKRFGPEIIKALNDTLVEKAKEQKIIRGKKLKLDTTVIEADIHYPTDASLLADGVRVITRTVKELKKKGAAVRTTSAAGAGASKNKYFRSVKC